MPRSIPRSIQVWQHAHTHHRISRYTRSMRSHDSSRVLALPDSALPFHPGLRAKLVARRCGDVEPGCHRDTTDEVRLELAVSKGVSTMLRPQPAGMGNTNVSTADVQCTSVMEAMHAYAHRKDAQSQSSVRAHSSNAGRRFDRHRSSRALRCVGTDSQALRRRTEQRASATIERRSMNLARAAIRSRTHCVIAANTARTHRGRVVFWLKNDLACRAPLLY
jgi:hypothetical protein